MAQKQIISIFAPHYDQLMGLKTSTELYDSIKQIVDKSAINVVDRKIILSIINKYKNSLEKLQMYVTNSMLTYQGLGVIK